jgi:hypothetical protein
MSKNIKLSELRKIEHSLGQAKNKVLACCAIVVGEYAKATGFSFQEAYDDLNAWKVIPPFAKFDRISALVNKKG